MLSNALLRSIRTIAVISFLSVALKMWPVTSRLRVSVEWYLRFPLWGHVRLPCWIRKSLNWFKPSSQICQIWPPASSDFWKAPLNENFHFGGQKCSVATLLALIASLIARVETNFAILTTIIRHLKRRLKMPCLGPVHTYLLKTVRKKAAFQKRSSEWRFLKTPASHFRVDGPKRRFSNTMMSYIIYTTSIMQVS